MESQVGRKKTPALTVVYKVETGEEREYNVLKFNKELLTKVQDLTPGDVVDISWNKNDRGYYDMTDIAKSDGPLASSSGSTAGAGPSTTRDTSSKKEWKKDPNKDRGVALSYALQYVLPSVHTKEELLAMDYTDYTARAKDVANLLLEYITGEKTESATDADIPTPDVDVAH